MCKSKYSEHQIVGALKRAEAEVPVKDLCRKLRDPCAKPIAMRLTYLRHHLYSSFARRFWPH